MWQRSICTLDGALQLLLLVDYIFDWARDIYRKDIIRELRILASGDNDAARVVGTDIARKRKRSDSPDESKPLAVKSGRGVARLGPRQPSPSPVLGRRNGGDAGAG